MMIKPKTILFLILTAVLAWGCGSTTPRLVAPGAPAPTNGPRAVRTPVEIYGSLRVIGNKICGRDGRPVQLKGMSLFWSQWGGSFWNKEAVEFTANDWNASVVRAAMAVELGGYLANPAREKAKVDAVVEAAVGRGIYVIIDWHDHNASAHTDKAVAFFTEEAAAYKDVPNVIFEPYNEPLNTESWESVKTYSITVIKAIRGAGADNLILVGSPSWCQNVHQPAADPITGFANIAYTLHFYAHTHRVGLRERARSALNAGIALFVSEWGTCSASGSGDFDPEESEQWLAFMDEYSVSWCNWSLSGMDETSAVLKPGAGPKGGWRDEDLTESGKFVRAKMRAVAPAPANGISR